jgi:hypothetical protein
MSVRETRFLRGTKSPRRPPEAVKPLTPELVLERDAEVCGSPQRERVAQGEQGGSGNACTPCTQAEELRVRYAVYTVYTTRRRRGSATPKPNVSRKEVSGKKNYFFLPVAKLRARLVYTVYTRF